MPNFTFVNNLSTTLANAITTTGQTVITLSSTANLPTLTAGQVLALTLTDAATKSNFEILYVTGIAGANLTVLRGQEGTAAQTWLVNDLVYAAATAGVLTGVSAAGLGTHARSSVQNLGPLVQNTPTLLIAPLVITLPVSSGTGWNVVFEAEITGFGNDANSALGIISTTPGANPIFTFFTPSVAKSGYFTNSVADGPAVLTQTSNRARYEATFASNALVNAALWAYCTAGGNQVSGWLTIAATQISAGST